MLIYMDCVVFGFLQDQKRRSSDLQTFRPKSKKKMLTFCHVSKRKLQFSPDKIHFAFAVMLKGSRAFCSSCWDWILKSFIAAGRISVHDTNRRQWIPEWGFTAFIHSHGSNVSFMQSVLQGFSKVIFGPEIKVVHKVFQLFFWRTMKKHKDEECRFSTSRKMNNVVPE